jgi:hypothetical protein
MNRPSVLIALAAFFSLHASAVAGDDNSPREGNVSTVKLLFIDHQPPRGMVADEGEGSPKLIRAGHVMVTVSALRKAKIYLDDEFVSDAMFGLVGAEPAFHLPSGVHSFRIECEGYRPFKSDIKVLKGGCEQYLVVVMQPDKEKLVPAAKANASAQSAASR